MMGKSWLRTGETEQTVGGSVKENKSNSSNLSLRPKPSPWRKQIIGALIGLGFFLLVAGILALLNFFR
jgi:hypothetical protein